VRTLAQANLLLRDLAKATSMCCVTDGRGDHRPLRERLAETRTPGQAVAVLGRRRVAAYSVGFAAVAIGLLGVNVYLVLAAALGWKGWWIILWMSATLPLALFACAISYADLYRRMTGRRPAMRTFSRVLDRLTSTI
jgi:hypothetical protein